MASKKSTLVPFVYEKNGFGEMKSSNILPEQPAHIQQLLSQQRDGPMFSMSNVEHQQPPQFQPQQQQQVEPINQQDGFEPIQDVHIPKTRPAIFVSIPSYRDSECLPTLKDLISKAKHPEFITVGVCQQLHTSDIKTLDILITLVQENKNEFQEISNYPCKKIFLGKSIHGHMYEFKHTTGLVLKLLNIDAKDAMGPTFARALIEKALYNTPADLCLLIDSHMCFEPNFDVLLADQYCKASDLKFEDMMVLINENKELPRNILTTYPYDYTPSKTMSQRKPLASNERAPATFLKFHGFYNPILPESLIRRTLQNSSSSDASSNLNSNPNSAGTMTSASSNTWKQFNNSNGALGMRRSDAAIGHLHKYNTSGVASYAGPAAGSRLRVGTLSSTGGEAKTTLSGQQAAANSLHIPQQDRGQYMHSPNSNGKPFPSILWAACFSFGPASQILNVPYDPFLAYVFIGEEFSMAIRLMSHGYRLYAPNINILYHLSTREYRPTYWEQFYSNTKHDLNRTASMTPAGQLIRNPPIQTNHNNANTNVVVGGLIRRPGGRQNANQSLISSNNNGNNANGAGGGGQPATGPQAFLINQNNQYSQLSKSIQQTSHKAKVSKEQQMERQFMEQQGYIRLYDLIIQGKSGTELYVPKWPQSVASQLSANLSASSNADINPNEAVLTLDENEAKLVDYSLGSHVPLQNILTYMGVYPSLRKTEVRARYGLTFDYKGTEEGKYRNAHAYEQSVKSAVSAKKN